MHFALGLFLKYCSINMHLFTYSFAGSFFIKNLFSQFPKAHDIRPDQTIVELEEVMHLS